MVTDDHQRSLHQLNVDTAGSICQDERLDAEQFESANWKRDFFERVAFVVMNAALHREDRHRIDFTDHEPSGMSLRSRAHETGNLFIRNRFCFLEVVGESAE